MIETVEMHLLFNRLYASAQADPASFLISEKTYRAILQMRLTGRLYRQWRKESRRMRHAKRRKYERFH